MMDEINSLLGFSHEREAILKVRGRLDDVIDRAIKTVKALPEFEALTIVGPGTKQNVAGEPSGELWGWFDPGKMERVMVNLLFNAAEAVPAVGGRIDVSVHQGDKGTEIRVSDNGPGIPPSISKTLFEPFVSYGKQKGTGLGLTVVHNVMHQHGGDATVERTGASGTTFLLRLPAEPSPDRG